MSHRTGGGGEGYVGRYVTEGRYENSGSGLRPNGVPNSYPTGRRPAIRRLGVVCHHGHIFQKNIEIVPYFFRLKALIDSSRDSLSSKSRMSF